MKDSIGTILLSTLLAGAAGYDIVSDQYTPAGAVVFSEGKFHQIQPVTENDATFVRSAVNTPVEARHSTNSGYADFVKTPIPQMDDYPKSPEEALARERGSHFTSSELNFGLVK